MEQGWIKLSRKLSEWEWYDNSNVFRLFIHCLLKANHKTKNWRGHTINKGSFITSRDVLAKELKLTPQQIRTALSKLKSTSEITIKTTNLNTLISIVKWDEYQQINQPTNKRVTNKQPTDNQQITTTKNDKKLKNDNNEKKKEFIDSDFLDVWNKWIDYKKELKDSYTTYKGEEGAYNKLIKLAGNNKAMSERIVNQSIENEWKGLFEFKGTIQEYNPEINTDLYLIPNGDKFGFSQEKLIDRCKQSKYPLK